MKREDLKKCYDIAVERATKICQVTGENKAWIWEQEFANEILDLAATRLRKLAHFSKVMGIEFSDDELQGMHIACLEVQHLRAEIDE